MLLRATDSFVWRVWGDENVLFNPASGDTHLLDPLSGEVLRLLESRPMSEADCESHVVAQLTDDLRTEAPQFVRSMLEQFSALGLVRTVQT